MKGDSGRYDTDSPDEEARALEQYRQIVDSSPLTMQALYHFQRRADRDAARGVKFDDSY